MDQAWFLPSECAGHGEVMASQSITGISNVMTPEGGHVTSPPVGNLTKPSGWGFGTKIQSLDSLVSKA